MERIERHRLRTSVEITKITRGRIVQTINSAKIKKEKKSTGIKRDNKKKKADMMSQSLPTTLTSQQKHPRLRRKMKRKSYFTSDNQQN